MSDEVEARLKALGFELPHPPAAVGSYIPVVQFGNMVITSGQLPFIGKDIAFQGKVGERIREEDGMHAARLCAVNALSQIKSLIGSLDRVRRIVRLEGYVQSAPGFHGQPHVLNGASELLARVFAGDVGKHTRIALGVSELPLNASVELAVWAEVEA